jgi:gliding motility-associated-like protein
VVVAPGIQTSFQNEATFCLSEEQKPLTVKAPPGTKILWNTGSISSNINATKEGWYWVKTENKNCGTRYDSVFVKMKACDCEMLIPNSFTPNEDNKNDYFFPVLQCEYSYYSFTVYDKWGNQIYTTNNPNGKWDGRFKGNLCEEDIYVYKVESTEKNTDKKVNRSGRVSLIR